MIRLRMRLDPCSRLGVRASNYEGIVNVGCGGYLDGVEYSSAEVAAWVAGLIVMPKLQRVHYLRARPV